jgi:PST family polysaccharide transporter
MASNRLIKNISALSLLQVINYILPLIIIPYLVRVVGVEKYGLIAFALSIAALIQIICDYGFNLSATKDIVNYKNNVSKISAINTSVIFIKALFLLTTLLLILIVSTFSEYLVENQKLFFYCLIVVAGNTLLPIWYFQGTEKMKYLLIYGAISRVPYTFFIFRFVSEEGDYILVPLLSGICALFSALLAIAHIRYLGDIQFSLPSISDINRQFANGWDIFISTIFIGSYNSAFPAILGITANMEAVGLYAAAERLLKVVKGLYNPISQALFPHFGSLFISRRKIKLSEINKYIYILSAMTLSSSLLLFLLSEKIVNLVLGAEFQGAILLLKIMSFIPFFAFISNIFGVQLMLNLGYSNEFRKIIIFISLIGLAAAFVMSAYFQEFGTAVSLLFIEFSMAFGMYLFFKLRIRSNL